MVDYNRDDWLDLFVANYIDFDLKTAPLPEAAGCAYKGIPVACGCAFGDFNNDGAMDVVVNCVNSPPSCCAVR